MKAFSIFLCLCLLNAQGVFAATKKEIPHLPPDATSAQYQMEFKRLGFSRGNTPVDFAIKIGERNLAWLNHMNSFRPEGKKIQLTRPGDLKGIPIEAAKSYSAQTVKDEYDKIYKNMPADMAKILYSSADFSDDLPISEADYVVWAKKVDVNYQTAIRWTMMEPFLNQLSLQRAKDLRGFYFLSKKTPDVENFLKGYSTQTADIQKNISDWLQQMCQNAYGLNAGCDTVVAKAAQAGTLFDLYKTTLSTSQNLWNSYFALKNPRNEIVWSPKNSNIMNVPLRDPQNEGIKNFLKYNIEDEYKMGNWHLNLDVVPQALIHVDFQAGVTPHVNAPGGDTITMDANSPLTEWDVQWTIRHEFGHVLGFVDCYLEFYDPNVKAITTYQLDIDNLMCARSGRMQQSMFDTLKKYYYK